MEREEQKNISEQKFTTGGGGFPLQRRSGPIPASDKVLCADKSTIAVVVAIELVVF
jgi:hypothetical protein